MTFVDNFSSRGNHFGCSSEGWRFWGQIYWISFINHFLRAEIGVFGMISSILLSAQLLINIINTSNDNNDNNNLNDNSMVMTAVMNTNTNTVLPAVGRRRLREMFGKRKRRKLNDKVTCILVNIKLQNEVWMKKKFRQRI